ncbi:MAG: hypothetical protein ABIA66_04300, partial [Candidatus Omnitrophota bacterium]
FINKKQLIVVLLAGIIIAVFFGFKTTHMYYPDYDYPSHCVDLSFYGKYIGSDMSDPPYPTLGLIAYAGNCKYQVIISTLIIAALLVYILGKRR